MKGKRKKTKRRRICWKNHDESTDIQPNREFVPETSRRNR
jgi:hypothetical protein